MKVNFYSKFIVLLISIIPQCFSAIDTESEYVAKGRAFITQHDTDRCTKYNADPAKHAAFKGHTDAIDTLLSDKSKVKQDEIASEEMIKTIITATIDKEITHFKDGSKPESRTKQTLAALDKRDPLYGHFTILSLFEDAAAAFVTGTANIFNSSDTGAIVSQADSFIDQITKLNVRITKKMFTDCLTITYGKHETGIKKVVATAEEETLRLAIVEQEKLQKLKEAEEEAQRLKAEQEANRISTIKAIVIEVKDVFDSYEATSNQAIIDAGLDATNTDATEAKLILMQAVQAAKVAFDTAANEEGATAENVEQAKNAFEQAVTRARKTFAESLQAAKTKADEEAAAEIEKLRIVAEEEAAAAKLAEAKAIVAKGKPAAVAEPVKPTLLKTDYTKTHLSKGQKEAAKLKNMTQADYAAELNKLNADKNQENSAAYETQNAAYDQYMIDLAAYNDALAIVNAAKAKDTTTA